MRITLILTGKTKADYLKEGIDEYVKRIKRYAPFKLIVIPDGKSTRKTDFRQMKLIEGQQILQKFKPGDYVILLDERGRTYSSEKFAAHLSALEGRTGSVVFVVGGAYGFSEEVYKRANEEFSLSLMTFSHQMVRLIFTEQLYRAYSILNGEPYHHK
jgi:23S rRNA (pseudouridine1915-N3)-methyltransferase